MRSPLTRRTLRSETKTGLGNSLLSAQLEAIAVRHLEQCPLDYKSSQTVVQSEACSARRTPVYHP